MPKLRNRTRLTLLAVVCVGGACVVGALFMTWMKISERNQAKNIPDISPKHVAEQQLLVDQSHSPSPTPASVAAQPIAATKSAVLSFDERQKKFGPCVTLPILMYHHIDDMAAAKEAGHAQLTVDVAAFRKHLQYLKDHGYTVVPLSTVSTFFDQGTPPPKKAIVLTVDDGYQDFFTQAYPLLQEFQYPATLFVPTGLVENPGYVTWNELEQLRDSHLITLSNHTWSHHNLAASDTVIQKEIDTARDQLTQHAMDTPALFAYPYGTVSTQAKKYLQHLGYELAVTTVRGTIQCKQQRMELPRIRIGNAQLSAYGL